MGDGLDDAGGFWVVLEQFHAGDGVEACGVCAGECFGAGAEVLRRGSAVLLVLLLGVLLCNKDGFLRQIDACDVGLGLCQGLREDAAAAADV